MKTYWLSSNKMTVSIDTDDNDIIIATADIVKKFKGQPLADLKYWMNKQGGLICARNYSEYILSATINEA